MASHASNFKGSFFPAETAGFAPTDQVEAPAVSAESRGLGCIRGLRYAIFFEIVAGFCAYEVWRFFRS